MGFYGIPHAFDLTALLLEIYCQKSHFPPLIDMNETIGETSSLYTNNNDGWNDWV